MSTTTTWTDFYFEGNHAWGEMKSPSDWQRVVKLYKQRPSEKGVEFLRKAKQNSHSDRPIPAFGFGPEYDGDLTLGQWADQQGMDLSA